ncbi:MAG: helix-turn-helix domain-containing protein [Halobacteriales archaeon]|nr:helix-turn-helix domain-containing protein [Halobacteriales archaeon]
MLKEIVVELSRGRAANPFIKYLIEHPGLSGRVVSMKIERDSAWEMLLVEGPEREVEELRGLVDTSRDQFTIDRTVIDQWGTGMLIYSKWRRPATGQDVSIPHLAQDSIGPRCILRMEFAKGTLLYRIADENHDALTRFFDILQRELQPRYEVKLVRVGYYENRDAIARAIGPEDLHLAKEALSRGYYDAPKRVGVRELGTALGLSKSVVARRLKAIERKALENLIAGK